LTTGSGATITSAPSSAAPNLGDTRDSVIGTSLTHARTVATKAKAVRVDHSGGEGPANAVICIAVMLACVIAYILVARTFMA
jgi:hypothetical protein